MTLAEVLVGFIDSMILDPQADYIFQTFVMIIDIYVGSVSRVQLPLHGCWTNATHLIDIENKVDSAFQYVF